MPVSGYELVGRDVMTSDGRNLGTVSDLAVDTGKWAVRDLRVAMDKRIAEELGLLKQRLGGGQFLVRVEHIRSVGDLVMLNKTMKELANMASSARGQGDDE